MTSRLLHGYTRLQSSETDSTSNFNSTSLRNAARLQDHSSDSSDNNGDSDVSAIQLRHAPKNLRRPERWPGSASHTSSTNPSDIQWDYIEHLIKPEETLQGLALQYRVSVFELKRANSIGKDVEFHARRIIKIPVPKHSSLKETVPSISQTDLIESAAADMETSKESNFLNQVDQDLQRIKERARVYDIDHESQPVDASYQLRNSRPKNFDCSGDDWGLSWTQLVCIALLLLLACPLLYFLHLELMEHKGQAEKRFLDPQPEPNMSIH